MKQLFACLVALCLLAGCSKTKENATAKKQLNLCDMSQVLPLNAAKVTITNGVWGTVSEMKGNCMPMVGPGPSGCSHCCMQRTVQIYQYTTAAQANAAPGQMGFYNSFTTQLVKQVVTDAEGFFQADLPAGKYSIVIVENGKLYSNVFDGGGGIGGVQVTGGQQRYDFVSTYQATF
jgi:outer membrane murein-binding lipoprotein Lpp